MFKNFLFLSILTLALISCTKSNIIIKKDKPNLEFLFVDTVQKEIIYLGDMPSNFKQIADNWFNKNIKTNGIDGYLNLYIKNYKQSVSIINNGKRIDISFNFEILINKNNLSQSKTITGNIEEFSTISGDFSMNDLENLTHNTQLNLISRLNDRLISEI